MFEMLLEVCDINLAPIVSRFLVENNTKLRKEKI